ncbi:hypothetical protein NPX13_g4923 [Xylaria arbuscula]|uniref:Uncharacterized protein n=1 Tax=Xylaria arbuscula TaxID=114810 RepID=A0A9W8TLS2_9PEZI|nr:hypothetical protein NPX13_g4923 [Xylaria arbuscula]
MTSATAPRGRSVTPQARAKAAAGHSCSDSGIARSEAMVGMQMVMRPARRFPMPVMQVKHKMTATIRNLGIGGVATARSTALVTSIVLIGQGIASVIAGWATASSGGLVCTVIEDDIVSNTGPFYRLAPPEQPPGNGVELPLALGLLDETDAPRDELGKVDEELDVGVELNVDEGSESPPIYGHGLQSLYENPQVWPRRQVQVEPDESRQFEIPVQLSQTLTDAAVPHLVESLAGQQASSDVPSFMHV